MIRLLRERLKPYWRQILVVLVLLLVQAIANLYLPTLNADIINNGVLTGDTAYILKTGGLMLLVTLVFVAAAVVAVYWGSKVAMAFGRDVRGALFRRVESFSQAEVNHFGTPSLITRTTNDVQQVQMVVLMMLNVVISAPIMAIGGIIMALRLDVPLSAVIVIAIPVMAVFIGLILSRAIPLFMSMQKKIDRINQVTREMLSGVRVIRAFARIGYEEQRFDAANLDLTDTTLRVNRLFALMMPTLTAILNLSTVAIMWFGSIQVADHGMPIGDLTAFLTYIVQILVAVLMATIMFVMVPRAAASAQRIQEVLETDPTIVDPAAPADDVTGGRVLVDGVDVRDMAQQDLWGRIGLVPQKAFLFSGTVASNLRDGDDHAADEELWRYLEIAQGREFVAEMPEELEAPVSQGGASVSGGQRQRLAIARALAKRAKIHIFDDSFSALDFATDARLRAALKRETTDATVIIVAQRVGTIMHADRIIVLEDGAIAGMGTHDELMQTNETYREIVASQFGEGEVA